MLQQFLSHGIDRSINQSCGGMAICRFSRCCNACEMGIGEASRVHTCPDKRLVSVRPNATTIPFPWHWSISQSCGGMAILQIFSMLQCMIIHSACFLLPSILSISALHTFEDLAFCPCYNLGSLLLLPASFAFSSGSYRTALYLELSLTCAFDVFCEHLLHFW